MHVAQFTPSLEARHGGPSRSVRSQCEAMARHGDTVDLAATDPGPLSVRSEGALTIRLFPRDRPRDLCASSAFRAWSRSIRPDIVHHHALWLRTLHYAHQCAKRSSCPLVVSPRGMMNDWAWNHRRGKKLLASVVLHPGAFTAVSGWHATSEEEARAIKARGFRQPVCIAPNGVDEPLASDIEAARTYWQATCPEVATHRVALFYSRFHSKKRVVELIDAWSTRGPRDWMLLMVGIPEGYSVEQLRAYAETATGGGPIRIFDGTEAPAPYPVASLFLLPSHTENFGLAIAEAMAHALPVLVTNGTPWAEVERRGIGWCVPWERYPQTLQDATALDADALRTRGREARTWVLAHYSWDQNARTLRSFYESLRA